MLENDRLMRALRREPVSQTPIWLMRQAGRYLPEYRALRQKAGSFLAMAKNPSFACEVALQPLQRFPLDGVIVFSDILTIPDAMGLGLSFVEGDGPRFQTAVRTSEDVARLRVPDMDSDLRYVMDAVRLTRQAVHNKVPVIGFSGSPWTLACYMVEGGSSKQFTTVKSMAYQAPELLDQLLTILTNAVLIYLDAQRQAGAQILQVFDTWGGILSPDMYRRFSLPSLQRIARSLNRGQGAEYSPLILFGRGNGPYLSTLAQTGADAISVDWNVDLTEAARQCAGTVALQGNLDPSVLYCSPDTIAQQVKLVLDRYAAGTGGSPEGHVFNLGHGVMPDIPTEHVAALIEAVQTMSQRK